MVDTVSSVGSAMQATAGVGRAFQGSNPFSGVMGTLSDFRNRQAAQQAAVYEGAWHEISANWQAGQMEAQAHQLDAQAELQMEMASFKKAQFIDQAGQVAANAMVEESLAREDFQQQMAVNNAVSAGRNAEGMSQAAWQIHQYTIHEQDVALMKLAAAREADSLKRNAILQYAGDAYDASVTGLEAANLRLQAPFVRFGGAYRKTTTSLLSSLRQSNRGSASQYATIDRWMSSSKRSRYNERLMTGGLQDW